MQDAVLIVGAGPVGLTMAVELARFGVPVRIIDKAPQRTDKSKALVVWSRTLELLDRSGCGERFVAQGVQVRKATITAGDRDIAHVRLDEIDSPHPYALMIPQCDTERLLEEHLGGMGIHVERQVELTAFNDDGGHVAATLRHADGQLEPCATPWLIGCDGAHSSVRHGLGMEFEGDTLQSDWILADVDLASTKIRPDAVHTFWHAQGVLAVFPMSATRFRVIADVGDVKPDAPRTPDPTLQQVQAIVDVRGPGDVQLSNPHWLSSFRINERKVADYCRDRVFLAGDAAHIHSPAGGQGMNTGMQDAFNLSWKLALVHAGIAAPSLLESYSIERSAVGQQVLRDAGRLTALAIMRNPLAQIVRNHVATLVFGVSAVHSRLAEKLTEMAIGYPHSPLTLRGRHSHRPAAGERAPARHSNTTSAVGAGSTPRFALFAKPDAGAAALLERHAALMEPRVREPFADDGAWLVRPDGYVAAAVRHGDWTTIDAHLRSMLGAPGHS